MSSAKSKNAKATAGDRNGPRQLAQDALSKWVADTRAELEARAQRADELLGRAEGRKLPKEVVDNLVQQRSFFRRSFAAFNDLFDDTTNSKPQKGRPPLLSPALVRRFLDWLELQAQWASDHHSPFEGDLHTSVQEVQRALSAKDSRVMRTRIDKLFLSREPLVFMAPPISILRASNLHRVVREAEDAVRKWLGNPEARKRARKKARKEARKEFREAARKGTPEAARKAACEVARKELRDAVREAANNSQAAALAVLNVCLYLDDEPKMGVTGGPERERGCRLKRSCDLARMRRAAETEERSPQRRRDLARITEACVQCVMDRMEGERKKRRSGPLPAQTILANLLNLEARTIRRWKGESR